jgi:hypothetical protein
MTFDKYYVFGFTAPESAAWMEAGPGEHGSRMPDDAFDSQYQWRLGLPQFKPTDKCRHCDVLIGVHGEHALVCPHRHGKSARNNRHSLLQAAWLAATEELKECHLRFNKNQSMSAWFSHTPAGLTCNKGNPADYRMDVGIENAIEGPAARTIIDFTITCPKPHHLTLRAAATEKEASKKNKYLRAYSIPQAKKYLIPWAMEASGAAGPKALQFTVQLAEWYSLHLGTK